MDILWLEEILWKKSCITLDGWNPINDGINLLSTGGFFFFPYTFLTVSQTYHHEHFKINSWQLGPYTQSNELFTSILWGQKVFFCLDRLFSAFQFPISLQPPHQTQILRKKSHGFLRKHPQPPRIRRDGSSKGEWFELGHRCTLVFQSVDGAFHGHGGTPIAGWSIIENPWKSMKIPSKMDEN